MLVHLQEASLQILLKEKLDCTSLLLTSISALNCYLRVYDIDINVE
jgi:hypothetical protein